MLVATIEWVSLWHWGCKLPKEPFRHNRTRIAQRTFVSESWVDCRVALFCEVNAATGAARARMERDFMIVECCVFSNF